METTRDAAAAGGGAPVLGMKAARRTSTTKWRGVNLGGWLLLERGPSSPLFERHGTWIVRDGTPPHTKKQT